MLTVMLEEQRQRTLNEALMVDLEQRVFERTQELELEMQERKLADEALRESEERQRSLLNNTSSVIYIKDVDGRYLFVNRMYETLFHISDEAIQGRIDHDIFPSNMADAFRAADLKAIESDMPLEFEETAPQDDGEHIYISVKFPLKDRSGAVYAVCGISTDITKRKQAEEELRHLRNYLSNIIDSMPSVLIGVDTDDRVILWNKTAEQTTGIAAADAQDKRLADVFPRMAAEMETIIESIRKRETKRNQKRPRQSENGICYEDVTIYPLIANGVEGAIIRVDDVTDKVRMEEMMMKKFDFRQIEIVRDYEENLPDIPCESGKIQQVFLNILRNGAEAMQEEAEQEEDKKPRFILRLAHEQAAGRVRIEIEDNGPGMDEAVRKRVFEPFFTTKPVGLGTGLGLSVSYFIIIENHGGEMGVKSTPGEGTTFIISLSVGRRKS
ncbi:MAG: PAS domain-containing protein [bacterium]|nr:PAS domain-containing protein [bacterium]